MNRTEKAELVEGLAARLGTTPLLMLADYRGVTVQEIDTIRRELQKNGLEYQVIKNTLARRALAGTRNEPLGELLVGMTGMVISGEDPIASAKVVREVLKPFVKLERFIIKGGIFDGEVMNGEDIQKVADFPGRPEMLATMLATIIETPRRLLGVIQGPARDLLYLLKNYEAKLAEAEGDSPQAG